MTERKTPVTITAIITANISGNDEFKKAQHFIEHLIHCAAAGLVDFTDISDIRLTRQETVLSPLQSV